MRNALSLILITFLIAFIAAQSELSSAKNDRVTSSRSAAIGSGVSIEATTRTLVSGISAEVTSTAISSKSIIVPLATAVKPSSTTSNDALRLFTMKSSSLAAIVVLAYLVFLM